MTLVEFFLQPGYPKAKISFSLVGMLNLKGGVLPNTYGGGPSTRKINLLLSLMREN